MRFTTRTLIVIVILVAVVAIGSFLLSQNSAEPAATPTETAQTESTELLAGVSVDMIERFRVGSQAALSLESGVEPGTAIAFVQDDEGNWFIEEDSSGFTLIQADVQQAAETLAGLLATESFTTDDLDQFGLAEPVGIITITTAEETYTIRIGDQNPSGNRYYATFGEDESTVYLLNAVGLIGNVLELRESPPYQPTPTPTPEPQLNIPGPLFTPPLDENTITAITWTDNTSDYELVLERDADTGIWSIAEAEGISTPAEADATLVSVAISIIAGLEAVDALPGDNLEALGLTQPDVTLTIAYGNEQSATLQIGADDPSGTRTYALLNDFERVPVLDAAIVQDLRDVLGTPPVPIAPEATEEATEEASD